ncbi:hypothetical protein TNCV_3495561 [Trichonephila clavipes]|nr:hypothetical protein TNCV_3495561 [Trichonephila clavipes]
MISVTHDSSAPVKSYNGLHSFPLKSAAHKKSIFLFRTKRIGLINEYQAFLGTKHWGGSSHRTVHLTGTSARAPQCPSQMNSLAASVKLTYSATMVDRLTDFCLKVRHEIGVSSIKVINPPIDTRSSLFVAKSESE